MVPGGCGHHVRGCHSFSQFREGIQHHEFEVSTRPAPTRAFDVPLWADRPRPSMRVVPPATLRSDASPAIVVFRGGAYASSSGSGAGTAEWIATKGMVGIEAAYGARNTNTFYPANYADGARAIRLVRSRAREWSIDEHRVAVLGVGTWLP